MNRKTVTERGFEPCRSQGAALRKRRHEPIEFGQLTVEVAVAIQSTARMRPHGSHDPAKGRRTEGQDRLSIDESLVLDLEAQEIHHVGVARGRGWGEPVDAVMELQEPKRPRQYSTIGRAESLSGSLARIEQRVSEELRGSTTPWDQLRFDSRCQKDEVANRWVERDHLALHATTATGRMGEAVAPSSFSGAATNRNSLTRSSASAERLSISMMWTPCSTSKIR